VDVERLDAREVAERALGRRLTPFEVSHYWLGRGLQFIRSEPGSWLRLIGLKLALLSNSYEVPDVDGMIVYEEQSPLLLLLNRFSHFGLLSALAGAGVILTAGRWRRLWVLHVSLLAMIAPLLLFYVLGRYRHAFVPLLALFASAALDEAASWRDPAKLSSPARLTVAIAVALGIALVTQLPTVPRARLDAIAVGNLGVAHLRAGRLTEATWSLERSVSQAPASPELRYNLGLAYTWQHRYRDAVKQFEEVCRLQPGLLDVEYRLAYALEQDGRIPEALDHYRRAIELDPGDGVARAAVERLSTDRAGSLFASPVVR